MSVMFDVHGCHGTSWFTKSGPPRRRYTMSSGTRSHWTAKSLHLPRGMHNPKVTWSVNGTGESWRGSMVFSTVFFHWFFNGVHRSQARFSSKGMVAFFLRWTFTIGIATLSGAIQTNLGKCPVPWWTSPWNGTFLCHAATLAYQASMFQSLVRNIVINIYIYIYVCHSPRRVCPYNSTTIPHK